MFGWGIGEIAASPFGRSPDGAKVVKSLREKLASGDVLYGGTIEGSRTDYDGKTIRLEDNYRGKALQSIVELVHEGSHVTWRQAHEKPKDPAEAKKDDEADEALARKNQLSVYAYLPARHGWPADEEIEVRLRRTGGHSAR